MDMRRHGLLDNMLHGFSRWLMLAVVLLVTLVISALSAQAAAIPKLTAPPEGDRWYSVNMGDERVGFAHLRITRAGEGYRIESESSAKMHGMGFSRESTSKESYLVGPDLALKTFAADFRSDGKPMTVKGEVGPAGIRMAVESNGEKKTRTVKSKGAVYPPQALNIYPLMHDTKAGKSYKVPMLDLESLKVKQVKVEVIGQETLPPATETVHLRNNLYPIVDNDIWVDPAGNTVRESVRDDLIVTVAEDAATARLHLAEDALAKKETVLGFSLVPVAPIERPEELKKLSVEMSGIPDSFPLPQGKGEQAMRNTSGAVVFTMPNPAFAPSASDAATKSAELAPSATIPSDAGGVAAKKDEIVGAEKDPAKQVRLLAQWVAKEIKEGGSDSRSVLELLKKPEGSCLSRARLYAALARAAGIPTRLVSGLVYLPGKGFLYHSWAESYLDGWTPVDPTYAQVPADLTHIELVQGDSPDELAALTDVIGKLQAKVIEKVY